MMRKKFLTTLYLYSQRFYTTLFKSSLPWGIRREELLQYHPSSLGYRLGCFLEENQFELIPKVEQHDVYHVLTGYGIAVEDEVALQFLCLGNGKRSLYLFGAVFIGALVLPEYLPHYFRSYQRGKSLVPFYGYNYRNLLEADFRGFRDMLESKQASLSLNLAVHCKLSSL